MVETPGCDERKPPSDQPSERDREERFLSCRAGGGIGIGIGGGSGGGSDVVGGGNDRRQEKKRRNFFSGGGLHCGRRDARARAREILGAWLSGRSGGRNTTGKLRGGEEVRGQLRKTRIERRLGGHGEGQKQQPAKRLP